MKNLLVITAFIEALTGVVLIVSPAIPVLLLAGAALDTTGGLLVARIAGAAVLVYAGLVLKLAATGLWPAVLLHLTLAAWCIACLRQVSRLNAE